MASDRPWFRRFRLGSKLTVILSIAALLPVATASTVAVRLVLNGLESGVRQQTDRTLRVGLNLMLSNVKEVFEGAGRLAENPRLADRLAGEPRAVSEFIARHEEEMPAGLLQVADARGRVVAWHGRSARFSALTLSDGADLIRSALAYERHVTLEAAGGELVLRAAAPVVDDAFVLRGAVVLTVPLDAEFADRLKAELAADVVFYAADAPMASSFVAPDGRRRIGFPAPETVVKLVARGGSAITEVHAYGRTWSVGYAQLLDLAGRQLGMFAVANDQEHLEQAKSQAWRSIGFGGAAALAIAFALAAFLTRALTRPLARLHEGARAVARGDLDTVIRRESGDEIGDLADALAAMTRAVRENQERLAARMREITTLHEIGRAVSSVLGLEDVLRRIVEQLTTVLGADKTALLFASEGGALQLGAHVNLGDSVALRQLCQLLYWWDGPLLIADISAVEDLSEAAGDTRMTGSLMAVPLEQKDDILGLMLVNRQALPFTDNDLRLVATFADHAATAIRNARLYEAVQRASEDLERKVEERTAELTAANQELERILSELGQAQAQLVLSERMAGLGFLVAGIAHEINSPAGAIQGSIDTLGDNVEQLVSRARDLASMPMTPAERSWFFRFVADLTPQLAQARVAAPAQLRRQARELAAHFAALGVVEPEGPCRVLVELGAAAEAEQLVPLAKLYGLGTLVGYLEQYAYLHRNILSIRTAIRRITRIVGALKGYSHLDQARAAPADVHEGIENTLVILDHELARGITVVRKYADLPTVPVYVDELNQVWTNLIHNAVQALRGTGEISIETSLEGEFVSVVVQDNGPGIARENVGRIFDPFFTTKPRGEGTGLGLGIVRQIVDKHGGTVEVTSQPGCTRFVVRLPVNGPPRRATEGGAVAVG